MAASWAVILGCPRSGTTFLTDVTSGADATETAVGRVFPSQVGPVLGATNDPELRRALGYSLRFTLNDHLEAVAASRTAALVELLRGNSGLAETFDGLRRRRRLSVMVYKEPFLAFAPEYPYEALPGSRIIHIHRDGRDAADSLVRTYDVLSDARLASPDSNEVVFGRPVDGRYVPWWVAEGAEGEFLDASQYVRAVWMWREMVRLCTAFAARPDVVESGRVMAVKYEDVVSRPMEVGMQVIQHLGLKPNRRIEARLRAAKVGSIGIHRKRPQAEVARATALAGAELAALGYV